MSEKAKILILEDEEIVVMALTRMLQRSGIVSTVVDDGAKVIELYRESVDEGRPYDLLLLDLLIPGRKGGMEVISDLRPDFPALPVIISSALTGDPAMSDPNAHGFTLAFPKPYKPLDLISCIEEILALSR